MLYNAYRKVKVKWDVYSKQQNLATTINKQSKLAYFRERCDGGPKNQSIWRTNKPLMSDKSSYFGDKIIIQETDKIINDMHEIYEIFNTYFTPVADNIILMTCIHIMDFQQSLISTVIIPVLLR